MKMESDVLKKIEELKKEIERLQQYPEANVFAIARAESKLQALNWVTNLSQRI